MTTNVPFIRDSGITRLEAEITIIVPSTKGVREQRTLSRSEMDERVNGVRRYLSKLFGGYTSMTATGGYVMKNGNLVQENVVEVKSFGDRVIALRNRGELLRKMKRWCIEFQQEAVSMVWETDLLIIRRK